MSKPSDDVTAHKIRSQKKGRTAEALTRLYLRLSGYRILGRNVRTPLGEIDIIAQRGNTLSFVEVKARASLNDAMHAVRRHQQRRIYKASQYFIGESSVLNACQARYDVALLVGRWRFRYLKDAWRPDAL